MKCDDVQPELVAYHFGVISDETRENIDTHLLECARCLRSFLGLKRAVETADAGPYPSADSRDRLRRAVAIELERRLSRRRWSWWEKPAAFVFAGSALVAALLTMRALTSGPGAPPHSLASSAAATESGPPLR